MPDVTCPSCFEVFEILAPPFEETPSRVDYDCEICCRPMVVHFENDGMGKVMAEAYGLDQ